MGNGIISIQASLTELERSQKVREALLSNYNHAVRDVGHYAIELDPQATSEFRSHVAALADEIATARMEVVMDSPGTLRALLRDFRDKGTRYIVDMRDELAGTARALEEILESLSQTDGDHETRLRASLSRLREISASPVAGPLGTAVASAADTIEDSIEQMKKQHQLTVSQFMTEIRVLHRRIDSLETAATVDNLTRLANRAEMTERIRASAPSAFCVVLIGLRGLLRAEVQFGKEVGEQLAAAFAKRLANSVPTPSATGRWGAEEFITIVSLKKSEALALGKRISENLSGSYACLKMGKSVRPTLQLTVGIIDAGPGDSADRILQRIDLFFGARS